MSAWRWCKQTRTKILFALNFLKEDMFTGYKTINKYWPMGYCFSLEAAPFEMTSQTRGCGSCRLLLPSLELMARDRKASLPSLEDLGLEKTLEGIQSCGSFHSFISCLCQMLTITNKCCLHKYFLLDERSVHFGCLYICDLKNTF